jgi:hypothetical protein
LQRRWQWEREGHGVGIGIGGHLDGGTVVIEVLDVHRHLGSRVVDQLHEVDVRRQRARLAAFRIGRQGHTVLCDVLCELEVVLVYVACGVINSQLLRNL